MSYTFKIVKVNKYLTHIRLLSFVILFLPIFFVKIHSGLFGVMCILAFIVLYILLSVLLKFYKIIGTINFKEDKLELNLDNNEILSFNSFDKLRLHFTISGFKGEMPNLFSLAISYGIGKLEIISNMNSFKFDILAEKDYHKSLKEILNKYVLAGAYVSFKKGVFL